MLCLHLFGSPHLTKAEPASGESTSVPLERFALAILASLAVSAPRGLARDRVLALLWPEVDAPRARHRLAQLRYALRRTLGVDPIMGAADLRLDPSIMPTDVQRFSEALGQGDFEQAVRLAQEPYLDGFC